MIATSNPEYMADYIEDDDLVILGDREEAQMQAIRSNASCIIIGGGLEVAEEVKKLAEKRDCVIITTPFDTIFRGASDQSEYADQAVHDQTGARHV